MTRISAIVAMSENRVIGKGNRLPWRLPEDLKRFKELTVGNVVIMGRKTFESIGKPLPQRENVVITRQKEVSYSGVHMAHSLEEALKWAEGRSKEIFIIGGEEIYRLALPYLDRLYLTLVQAQIEGDAFFPEEFSFKDYVEIKSEERVGEPSFRFLVLDRR